MEQNKIEYLLEKYYSGEISPDDYEKLLSILKEPRNLAPELEAERRILLAIESCEAIMPDGFENELAEAIDKRYKQVYNLRRIIWEGAAAAVVLICVLIGTIISGNKELCDTTELVSATSITQEEADGIAMSRADESGEAVMSVKYAEDASNVMASSHIIEESVITEISDEELDNAVKTIDAALLNVLSEIQMTQNEIVESFESIEINQTAVINI